MKHSRKDYAHIQETGKVQKIPRDEPVFLLRGQDMNAPATLRYYAKMCAATGVGLDLVDSVLAHADAMDDWQQRKRVKRPDL